jgi:ATP-binding cassette subfamily B protein
MASERAKKRGYRGSRLGRGRALPCRGYADEVHDSSPTAAPPLLRLLRHARPFRGRILWAAFCSISNKLLDLAPPFIIGAAIDVVVERQDSLVARLGFIDPMQQLLALGAATFLVWSLESLFEWLLGIAWRGIAQEIQHGLRLEAFRHTQTLELAWFENRSTGGLQGILVDDANQLERFLDGGANDLIQLAVTGVAVTAAFFVISPAVAWWAMLPVPVVIAGSLWYQRLLEPRYAVVRRRAGELHERLANSLGGIATVKSFTAEAAEAERLESASREYAAVNRRAIALSSAFSPLIRIVILAGFTVTLVYGGHLALEGSLAVGAYGLLVFLTQRLLWPFTRIGAILDLYQRAMASARRVLDLVETPPAIVDGPLEIPPPMPPTLRFENARFAYVPGHPVLEGLDLDCPAGKVTAIVGATGAGKSTLVKLLLRFCDLPPQGGAVTLNGVDLRELPLAPLRRRIALVGQEVYLFDGTVLENIALGDPAASRGRIEEAARLAEAHEFVQRLPRGYETAVGERGQRLSGGQRQRIAMARAILKGAPVLVLDEATSSVDNETEAAMQRSLRRIGRGRTTIVIAHRLSTVRHADSINLLEGGRVVERGRHEELLARGGLYARLWRVQTGEGAEEIEGQPLPPWADHAILDGSRGG